MKKFAKTKKVTVVGHFGIGENLVNGQTIKTKTITDELTKQLGNDEVLIIDTHGGKKTYFKLPILLLFSLIHSENIIIFPAHNGVRIIAPLLYFYNIFLKRKLHYVVIGGWIISMLNHSALLSYVLKRYLAIYVETETLKQGFIDLGYTNAVYMPNCKNIKIAGEEELKYVDKQPYKMCIFSRVMIEKGIEDAVLVIKRVNECIGHTSVILDIYGPVEKGQEEWFENIKKGFSDCVYYKGVVEPGSSCEVLKNYFALLFPTRFYTEGIPGTIIDAYSAGVPVICSRWESCADVVNDGKTGMVYDFGDIDQLERIVCSVVENPSKINAMRGNCLKRAEDFLVKNVVEKTIMKHID